MSAPGPRSSQPKPERGTEPASGAGRRAAQEAATLPPAPPWWRDPWAWASLLAMVPLLVRSLGAPLGVPVADDFDFMHRALLTGERSLLDGGGSAAFWRPIPHQIYYQLCSSLMLSRPLAVAALHTALLALTALLAYRAARTRLTGSAAAVVASFPLLAESTRAVVAWPCHMVDLSLLFFSVLALHEAAFRRLPTSLLALLAALLSKEVAVVTALLLPWVPILGPGSTAGAPSKARRDRLRWIVCSAGVTLVWGLAYLAVRRAQDLHLPHDLEISPGTVGMPWLTRYVWALVNSLRAGWSLPMDRTPWEPAAWGGLAVIVGVAVSVLVRQPEARARLRAAVPLSAFGALWFLAAAAPLTVVYPFWAPHRTLFGSLGLAVALAATLGAARTALLAGLVALRLATLALSPAPPAIITSLPPPGGAFLDFEKLVRQQRLMVETRQALEERHPTLPSGARVGLLRPPLLTEYAYGGARALQVWYRDSTLRWVRNAEIMDDPEMELDAIVLYEPDRRPQMMLVEPASMRHYLGAGEDLVREDWSAALANLAEADSLQADRTARMFLSRIAGRRALTWLSMGRSSEAEREARHALDLWRECGDGRYVLASVLAFSGRREAAFAQLDTLIRLYPNARSAAVLRDSLDRWTAPER